MPLFSTGGASCGRKSAASSGRWKHFEVRQIANTIGNGRSDGINGLIIYATLSH